MPIEKTVRPDVEPPKVPHLVVMQDLENMVGFAIPPGAIIAIVTDPKSPNGVLPLRLIKVTERQLKFECACNQPKCSAVFNYTVKVDGYHPRFYKERT